MSTLIRHVDSVEIAQPLQAKPLQVILCKYYLFLFSVLSWSFAAICIFFGLFIYFRIIPDGDRLQVVTIYPPYSFPLSYVLDDALIFTRKHHVYYYNQILVILLRDSETKIITYLNLTISTRCC